MALDQPITVSRLWDTIRELYSYKYQTVVTFNWFSMAMSLGFAMGLIEIQEGQVRRING